MVIKKEVIDSIVNDIDKWINKNFPDHYSNIKNVILCVSNNYLPPPDICADASDLLKENNVYKYEYRDKIITMCSVDNIKFNIGDKYYGEFIHGYVFIPNTLGWEQNLVLVCDYRVNPEDAYVDSNDETPQGGKA